MEDGRSGKTPRVPSSLGKGRAKRGRQLCPSCSSPHAGEEAALPSPEAGTLPPATVQDSGRHHVLRGSVPDVSAHVIPSTTLFHMRTLRPRAEM